MTIIFLSRYQNKVERGVENYVEGLSRRLLKQHHVEILTRTLDVVGKRADIIYPLNGFLQILFCRIYSWMIGARLVVGGHAGIGRDDRWNLYMFPDLFIAFSQKGYDWAKRVNPLVNVVKIHHGVDLEQFNPEVKPIKLNLERPIFICVSHLIPYKRTDETVKAIAKLRRGSLLILGNGPLEKEIDELGNTLLNGGRRKRYLRLSVPHKDVHSYLAASDIFSMISDSQEAFGLVYLEALACNKPVVTTDDSLRHELIGEAGLFIKNPENSAEYAAILEKAAEIHWNGKPRQQAKRFDWNTIIQQYQTVFERILHT